MNLFSVSKKTHLIRHCEHSEAISMSLVIKKLKIAWFLAMTFRWSFLRSTI